MKIGKHSINIKQNFLDSLVGFVNNFFIRLYLFFAILTNVLGWLAARKIASLIKGESIYLHYNVNFGVDYVGNVTDLHAFPILGSLILLINIFVYLLFGNNNKFFGQMLMIASIAVNVFILLALGSIYLINFR
ncbi:MAG: hypothetical protein NT091_01410 [Candidatus Falkowbacteria bacterium]|nr:hypothetical protein [Candidatus Falkowbacteria bacterium]